MRDILIFVAEMLFQIRLKNYQAEEMNTDTVIFSFNKIFYLLAENKTNALECLGCLPENYLFLNEMGVLKAKGIRVLIVSVICGYNTMYMTIFKESAYCRCLFKKLSVKRCVMCMSSGYDVIEGSQMKVIGTEQEIKWVKEAVQNNCDGCPFSAFCAGAAKKDSEQYGKVKQLSLIHI